MRATFIKDSVVLTMENQAKEFAPVWEHDPINSIGWIRGGTPAIKMANKNFYLGFSHAINDNNDIHAHTFGIYLFNPEKFTIQHKPLSKYVRNFLIDPYGIRLSGAICEIDVSIGIFDIHNPNSTVANVTFQLDILDIIQLNFTSEELKAVE
jgi:hypothetical protein